MKLPEDMIDWQLFILAMYKILSYIQKEGIIDWLNAHEAESWCVLDDEIFPNYEQLQIVEKLVKTCYMDGLTDDCVNEVIMKLTDDFMD